MLSQLKAELARLENATSIDDAIIENVNMESIKESFMEDSIDMNMDALDIDDQEIEMIEKVINDIPEYTNESDMNVRIKRVLEYYIPDFK